MVIVSPPSFEGLTELLASSTCQVAVEDVFFRHSHWARDLCILHVLAVCHTSSIVFELV